MASDLGPWVTIRCYGPRITVAQQPQEQAIRESMRAEQAEPVGRGDDRRPRCTGQGCRLLTHPESGRLPNLSVLLFPCV